ncbi:GyrI-like domain-containing protein [Ktedonospora formicarum]|uniref:DNA gyrase inhibitor n=1 Tax=Ktedonospora formicarum TaxID=2778364 RepID=A0A8J3MUQ7_9CHLR|nr:GyrI-like domain-containing protein [Ktedonospora formicarum]GHO49602.1 DNA gyrase inhibitor [Ktedonospora formicarum]
MFTEPKIDERPDTHYVGIRTMASLQEMGNGLIPRLHTEVYTWLKQQGVPPAGAPFIRYHVINMETKLDIELGVPVAGPIPDDERVRAGVLPAGRYASLIFTGIENGIKGNGMLLDWGAEHGLKWDTFEAEGGDGFVSRYESEITDPADEPDPSKWDTEVAIRIADEPTH